ncbi:MAG: NAD(P)/FAD-dependent oxidoreductase [Rhodanobacteraceae bacterium]
MDLDELGPGWDAVVAGAGVAGASCALHLARAGLRVLLVEKSAWPRAKVCGGCVNAAALRMLASAGIALHGGSSYDRLRLGCRGRTATLTLPRGVAMTRKRLDAIVVDHARGAGARFLPATSARLGSTTQGGREVGLRQGTTERVISARVVLDCGGLATRLADDPGWRVARRARIGVGATLPDAPAWYRPGVIHMACAAHGYVGLVRAQGDATNVAAALDPSWCAQVGGPAKAVRSILDAAGFPAPEDLNRVRWRGTPRLTRTRAATGAGPHVLALGDAMGYVEPFTGEGMAWALAAAVAVQPFAREAVEHWTDDITARWHARHLGMLRSRKFACRGITKLLRHPRLLAATLPLLEDAPVLIAPVTAWLNRGFRIPGAVNP